MFTSFNDKNSKKCPETSLSLCSNFYNINEIQVVYMSFPTSTYIVISKVFYIDFTSML